LPADLLDWMQFVRQPAFVLGKHLPKWLDGELYAGGGMWGGASFPLPWFLVSFYNIFAVGLGRTLQVLYCC
jgi:hypothetical protein